MKLGSYGNEVAGGERGNWKLPKKDAYEYESWFQGVWGITMIYYQLKKNAFEAYGTGGTVQYKVLAKDVNHGQRKLSPKKNHRART